MLFEDWSAIGRVLSVGILAYGLLVVALRISGKRTLAKMNAFDFVVTVALGSTLATILLTSTVSLAEGGVGLVLLVLLQYVVARAAVRYLPFRRLVKSEPVLLLDHGAFCHDALRRERVTEGEVEQAARGTGNGSLEDIAAVVLETDGSLSVIPRASFGPSGTALAGVSGWRGGRSAGSQGPHP
jgi:uncharacterized membrane protein YcaP (DUF421 family)